ncbi:GLPGLI family protein [Flavobacterium sp. TSSA_36]|uniref:GLPGLI family protein n=1 Tax=Flavobacterium sp. TSSA_36 TaxID=3447669 RepID=UPI003F3129C7
MKIIFLYFLLITHFIYGQNGIVEYKVMVSKAVNSKNKDVESFIEKIIILADKQKFKLQFNAVGSHFSIIEEMKKETNEDVKMFKIASSAFTTDSEMFYQKANNIIYAKNSDGSIIKELKPIQKWEITNESKTISTYLCYKAILKIPFINRKGISGIHTITAWFAPSLPFSFGPKNFYGLPGLILELQENKTTYLATKIVLTDKEFKIVFPKGKTITKEEYDKKLKAQMGM